MKRKTVVALFVLGSAVGIPLATLYIKFSPSADRYFHAFVMLAACCVSFPAVVIFLRITLKMWDMTNDNQWIMKEVKDAIVPTAERAQKVVAELEKLFDEVKTHMGKGQLEGLKRVLSNLSLLLDGNEEKIKELRGILHKCMQEAESDVEGFVWKRVDDFLSQVFSEGYPSGKAEKPKSAPARPEDQA